MHQEIFQEHLVLAEMLQFSKDLFDVSRTLQVMFVGESATDYGGPRREYFLLL